MNLANEGLEARKKEEEVAARKRKAEDDKTWEGKFIPSRRTPLPSIHLSFSSIVSENREQRVDSWRTFTKDSKKKKKQKTNLLG